MSTAAVVVRWRGGDEVDHCLRSLLEHSGGHLGRIVLVDSGSGDGGAERLAASFPKIDVIALPENRSFAHAANTGAATTDEDLLLLLNPDATLDRDALESLIAALGDRPRTAGAVPLLHSPDGSSQHRWQLRRLPSVSRLAMGLPGAPAFTSAPTSPAAVDQPAAAAWLIRREVWQALGGFDEGFAPAWWEDVDLCARLAHRVSEPDFPADEGFRVVPQAVAHHLGGSSVLELEPARFLATYNGNLVRFAARHHPDRLGLILAGLRVSLVARAILRPNRRQAYLSAERSVRRRTGA